MTAWTYLLLAGACEIIATTIFRYTDGFTRIVPTAALIVMGGISLFLLNKSMAAIPLGTAYAVWTGIGAAGTAIIGIAFYGEALTGLRVLCLAMLIGGIIGLKLFDA